MMNIVTMIMTIISMLNCTGAKIQAQDVNIYPMAVIVSSVDRSEDVVTFTNNNGDSFEWEGVEDLEVNDTCALMMCDMGTPENTDDVILTIRYSGFEIRQG